MSTIKTNNVPRLLLYANELTDQERIDFDYMDDIETGDFFRYKGLVYSIDEFTRVDDNSDFLGGWDGYSSDSYFSGVLIKLCDDTDYIIVGSYYN